MVKGYTMDMTKGPLVKNILLFALPLMLSSILQLLFNAADVVVVGRFAGSECLAAVGSCTALINLQVNLFMGLSIGASVLLGRYFGAKQYEDAKETVQTSMFTAIVAGSILVVIGLILSKPLLQIMGTPDDVIHLSLVYMRIYFCGMPALMIYNFGAALLRALGDTKRPLYFLSVAGVVNVIFNLFFVIVLHMNVDGVALATIISQYISAIFILIALQHGEDILHFSIKDMHFYKDKFLSMIRIGVPAGLQSIMFNISNVLIQSSVNSFGSLVMAGNTAAQNIEGFVFVAMNSLHQSCLSFTSQNYGAKQYKRIDQILVRCLCIVTIVGIISGYGGYLCGEFLLGIYSDDPQVIVYGMNRLALVCAPYFICGIMDVCAGSLRGMGYSLVPTLVSLTGVCAIRVIWIYTIFAMYHTQFSLYISYPISWIVTFIAHIITYLVVRKKAFAK